MSKQQPTMVSDLLPDSNADDQLRLTGGLCNLLGHPLRIVDATGRMMAHYPQNIMGPAYVSWRDDKERRVAPLLHAQVLDETMQIGDFNHGWVRLLRPIHDMQETVRFWQEAVEKQDAKTQNLPNMKPWRKRFRGSCFCVVPVGVALTAYFCYEELSMLFVPAGLSVDEHGDRCYLGLIPAGYLVYDQPIRRR